MAKVSIQTRQTHSVVRPELHGQFLEHLGTCIDGGVWVGVDSAIPNVAGLRQDVVDALAHLEPPLVRWPGGCYADIYHWRNGIGPREQRPAVYNGNFGTHRIEHNELGTHEFMDLCARIGAKPWLNVNLLTGSVAEMVEWAEYCNRKDDTTLTRERAQNGSAEPFDVRYWGIGNEAWAGGGFYTPQSYAAEYRKYATAFPSFDKMTFGGENKIEHPMTLIAVGPDGNKPRERVAWTRQLFQSFAEFRPPRVDALDLHFYNWNIAHPEDTVTDFSEADWYRVLQGALEIEAVICEQYALIQEGLANYPEQEGPFQTTCDCRLIIGEWGNWHKQVADAPSALWQQSTMRDALTSAITLDIFHRHSDKLAAACAAQSVNVLNSLILTQGESTILTPTYHVFDLYKVHRGGVALGIAVDAEMLDQGLPGAFAFASERDGVVSVNLINVHFDQQQEVELEWDQPMTFITSRQLAGEQPTAHNTRENPEQVTIQPGAVPVGQGQFFKIALPPASVTVCQFRTQSA